MALIKLKTVALPPIAKAKERTAKPVTRIPFRKVRAAKRMS